MTGAEELMSSIKWKKKIRSRELRDADNGFDTIHAKVKDLKDFRGRKRFLDMQINQIGLYFSPMYDAYKTSMTKQATGTGQNSRIQIEPFQIEEEKAESDLE